ncbi:hypothetical protein, partial [Pseudomonas aeruginosa]
DSVTTFLISTVAGIMQEISKGAEHVARVVSSLFK